jgi:tetratricopeptide (TPR) repeat protein
MRLLFFSALFPLIITSPAFCTQIDLDSASIYNQKSEDNWRRNPDSAIWYARAALTASRSSGSAEMEIKSLRNLGASFFFDGRSDSARFYWQRMQDLSEIEGDSSSWAAALANLSILNQRTSKYLIALEQVMTALRINLALNDSIRLSNNYNNIGIIYEETGEYSKAIEFHRLAMGVRRKLEDSALLSSTYVNIASCFNALEQYDSAIYYAGQSTRLKEKFDDQWGLLAAYLEAATSYAALIRVDDAMNYYDKAIKTAEEVDNLPALYTGYIGLGWLYFQQGRVDEAKKLLDKINFGFGDYEIGITYDYHDLNYAIAEKMGNRELAYQSLTELHRLSDSLNLQRKERALTQAKMSSYQEVTAIQQNLEEEINNLRLQREAERRERTILSIGIAVAFLFILLVILLFNYRLIKRKNESLLKKQKEIDLLLAQQKEMIDVKTEELIASQSLIDRYAFLNSHELRAPVARILGMLSMRESENLDEKTFIRLLQENLSQLDSVIKKISKEIRKDL